ncbi:MAG: hypothetical protein JXB13_14425 [Phycisphaerae bacterium]|nr:hypothetical protein [Phycisphaerae bacterium]
MGRRAKCPKCEHKFTIEVPAPTAKPKQPDALALDEDDDASSLMESLAAEARTAAAAAPPTPPRNQSPCPKCGTMMPADARLCVSCGYDVKAGRGVKPASAGPGKVATQARAAALSAGGFMLGTALSAVAALIGAGIWCAVALATGYEFVWIAIGLGALAGFGMRLGYRQENFKAGAVAAILTVGGIAMGKILIVAFVLWPAVSEVVDFKSPARNLMHSLLLTSMSAELRGESFLDDEFDVEDVDTAGRQEARAQAAEIYAKLSDEQLRDRYVRYNRYSADFPIATADEREFQKNWVAAAIADRRGDLEGIPYDDYARQSFYEEETERLDAMPEAQLDAAIRDHLAWEKEGRWQDEEYVAAALVAARVREIEEAKEGWTLAQKIEDIRTLSAQELFDKLESGPEGRPLLPKEWDEIHSVYQEEVQALSNTERVARVRKIILDREKNEQEFALALEGLPSLESLVVSEGVPSFAAFALRNTVDFFDILFVSLAVVAAYKIASGEAKTA